MGNFAKRALVALINFYRRNISNLLGPRCRFYPSCSVYAIQAIEKYGAAKGAALAAWRILRCNPFGKGGFDPVK